MAELDIKIDLTRMDNPQIYMYKGLDLRKILFAPPEYWKLILKEHKEICNRAGPKGFGWLVPNTIYFLNIGECANIHDFMYKYGVTIQHKEEADRVFLNNMIRWILHKTKSKIMKWLRLGRAQKYFSAVCIYGGPAFWKGKNNI